MRRLRAMLIAYREARGEQAIVLTGLGFGDGRTGTIETDDPDSLIEALRAIPAMHSAPRPANFRPVGKKRDVLRLALGELHRAAAATVDIIALSEGAPLGAVEIDVGGCTLCLSCVSACPTGALRDDPERPMLRFVEDACVQCGLCQATCPEKFITLKPQIDFRAARAPARILKEEEPFCCISCGKPFGVKSTIEWVVAKLESKHWMYTGSSRRLDVIKMCEDCRVAVAAEQGFDPYGAQKPTVRARPTIICVSGRCNRTTARTSVELPAALAIAAKMPSRRAD
jgi:ferredoxin